MGWPHSVANNAFRISRYAPLVTRVLATISYGSSSNNIGGYSLFPEWFTLDIIKRKRVFIHSFFNYLVKTCSNTADRSHGIGSYNFAQSEIELTV